MLNVCRRSGKSLTQYRQSLLALRPSSSSVSTDGSHATSTSASPEGQRKSSPPIWKLPEGQETGVVVYNVLARQQVPLMAQPFKPLSWYMCGPTVYDSTHIGHAHCYMWFDIIRKILKNFFSVRVRLVMNFTDVDDKIIRRSLQLGIPIKKLTKQYEEEFLESLDAMKIERANEFVRVTEHIPAIADFIRVLLSKGYAYHSRTGDINFDSIKFRDMHHSGKLVSKKFENNEPPAPSSGKRHVADFALWKRSGEKELGWDMEWDGVGVVRGRPGWHIECSTLAKIAFGDHVQIHSGGLDLKFPHHENELVQSEAYHGVDQWVDYFMHSGSLLYEGSKMSKSLGNFITVKDFLKDYTPDEFRMLCAMNKYSKNCDYNAESMAAATATLTEFATFHGAVVSYLEGKVLVSFSQRRLLIKLGATEKNVLRFLGKNFNVPAAIVELTSFTTYVLSILGPEKLANKEMSLPGEALHVGAVVASHTFVRYTLQKLGFEMAFMRDKCIDGTAVSTAAQDSVDVKGIVDEFMAFRSTVRDLSIGRIEQVDELVTALSELQQPAGTTELSADDQKKLMKRYRKITSPYLKASDKLRESLSQKGIDVKDLGVESRWNSKPGR